MLRGRDLRNVAATRYALASVVAALGLPALWRLTRRDGHLLAVWTLTLTPWLAALSWVTAVGAAWLRRPGLTVAVSSLGGAYARWTLEELGRAPADVRPNAPRGAGGTGIRVLTANLYVGNRVPEQMVAALAATGADVLLLQEVSVAMAEAIRASGSAVGECHGILDPRPDGDGTAIITRMAPLEATATSIGGRPATTAVLEVDGQAVRVLNVHPRAPESPTTRRPWTRQLAALRDRVAGEELPLLVAGDFNANGFHRELREVVRAGALNDAHRTGARGLGFTWRRRGGIPALVPPGSDLRVRSFASRAARVRHLAGERSPRRARRVDARLRLSTIPRVHAVPAGAETPASERICTR